MEEVTPFFVQYIRITLSGSTQKDTLMGIGELLKEYPGDIPVYVDIAGKAIQAQSTTSEEVMSHLQKLLGDSGVILV